MKRITICIAMVLSALAAATAASARPVHGLHIGGGMRPVYWTWAVDAAQTVPIPDARITLGRGDPVYYNYDKTMYLPWAGHDGWTAESVRGLFLHELGHVYDYSDMTPARRTAFKEAIGVTCYWWADRCITARWVAGPGFYVNVSPGEMFAEEYAACALGETQLEYQEADHNSYGWVPPQGTDEKALCGIIRGA